MELLRDYVRNRSEEAFAALVERHLNLVYSAALRQVRSPQLAEEVAQSAFAELARQAHRLAPDSIVSAWLYQVTRRKAIDVVRGEARRQLREQVAHELTAMNAIPVEWTRIEPLLDEAMQALDEGERTAIVLRYFENKSVRELSECLGTSEAAAQKRVSRAVERLRVFFAKRGVSVGASGLVVAISANAVQAAPIGLGATISMSAGVAGTTIANTTNAIVMTTLQKVLVTVTIAAAIGVGVYGTRQASVLREQNQLIQKERASSAGEMEQMQRERDAATNRLASLSEELSKVKGNNADLLKLRGEVTRMRAEAQTSPAARVALLRQKLEQMPEKKIPELAFATEKDWANAAWDADLSTDDGVREALSKLRETAINTFLNEMMKSAMKKYLAVHGDVLPAELKELKPYLEKPVTDEMLARYKQLQSGKVNNSEPLVPLTGAFADEEYDSNHGMSINGAWGGRFNRVEQAIKMAAQDFARDHNGQLPSAASDISGYLKKPVDEITAQKYLKQTQADPPPPEVGLMAPVLKAYADANGGQGPKNGLELVPYLTTPEQQAAFLKLEGLPNEAATLVPALKAYSEGHKGGVPKSSSDLLPYVTTAEQQAAIQKLDKMKKFTLK